MRNLNKPTVVSKANIADNLLKLDDTTLTIKNISYVTKEKLREPNDFLVTLMSGITVLPLIFGMWMVGLIFFCLTIFAGAIFSRTRHVLKIAMNSGDSFIVKFRTQSDADLLASKINRKIFELKKPV